MRRYFLLLVVLATSTAHAQRMPFPIPDPDPEVERKSFILADGFEVNLFAADPVLAKPIQMNFDPAGRLWVVSSEVYPQIEPGQTANDKVLIVEDRDGDGKADRTSVFADGLLIPTGVEPGDGGAYVANSTELLHFADTDHDGKADRRRVMLSGFGTEDTHHILHTLRWGYDGMLYFNQSIYIHSHIETPHGVRRLGGGGIWQFRPETMELAVFIRGLINPWGHHFDRWGQSFATDGAGGEGINYCLPGAYYATAPDAVRILGGLNPGSPKYCGEEFLSGRHLPESWRGSILTNDFRGNRVCRFVLSDDGAGFAAREQPELIKTRHVAFRPIDIKMGPDGAIYIADWYNPIIQHGEVDFRDPRRDHTRGRIWRVTAKDRPLVSRPRLIEASISKLLDALKAPEDWTRQNARRLLKERGKPVLAALADWVKGLDAAGPDVLHERLEALWTYQSLDVVEPALLAALLKADDARVRAAAVRVAGLWSARLDDPLGLLGPRVIDENPRVRLEAVRALARIKDLRAAALAMRALDYPLDRFLDYALWLTARELQDVWLPAVQSGRFDFDGHPWALVYALQAVGTDQVIKPLVALLKADKVPHSHVADVLSTIAVRGGPGDLAIVLDLALRPASTPNALRVALLEGLNRAARQRNVRPAGDLEGIFVFFRQPHDPLRVAAAHVAGAWKLQSARGALTDIAREETTSELVLSAAVDALAELGGAESRAAVRDLCAAGSPPRTRNAAIAALATLDPRAAAKLAVDRLTEMTDPVEADGLVRRFVTLRQGAGNLAAALQDRTLPADVAKVALRAVRGSGREDPRLVDALTRAGHLKGAAELPSAEAMAQIVRDVASLGDPARGEAVFRRAELNCLKCHAIAGAGGQVGPGLESIGASAPVDYLVDSILQPSKAVKENYHAITVATNDGKVITGIKTRQAEGELVLRDAEDRSVSIPLATIDEQKPAGSLMPVGLTESLTRGEFLDLVRFLSELGKIGPYSVGKERVVRRWRVLQPTRESAELMSRAGLDSAVEGSSLRDWMPAYSEVSGTLPLAALVPAKTYQGQIGMARFDVDVTTAGSITLGVESPAGLRLWIDGSKVETQPRATVELTNGIHTVTVAVDLKVRRDGVRMTLEDVSGSPARAALVVGK